LLLQVAGLRLQFQHNRLGRFVVGDVIGPDPADGAIGQAHLTESALSLEYLHRRTAGENATGLGGFVRLLIESHQQFVGDMGGLERAGGYKQQGGYYYSHC
jgi:hypothetical protein